MSAPRAATTGVTQGPPLNDVRMLVGRRGGVVPRDGALPASAIRKPIAACALALRPREAAIAVVRGTFHVKHVERDAARGALATGGRSKRAARAVRR